MQDVWSRLYAATSSDFDRNCVFLKYMTNKRKMGHETRKEILSANMYTTLNWLVADMYLLTNKGQRCAKVCHTKKFYHRMDNFFTRACMDISGEAMIYKSDNEEKRCLIVVVHYCNLITNLYMQLVPVQFLIMLKQYHHSHSFLHCSQGY